MQKSLTKHNLDFPERNSRKTIKYYIKNYGRVFRNAQCSFCNYLFAYILWYKFDTVGYCPDCNKDWIQEMV